MNNQQITNRQQTTATVTASAPVFDPAQFLVNYCKNKEELAKSTKPINFVMGADGEVYEVRKTPIADFCVKAQKVIGGANIDEGMTWKLPKKIPFQMFLQIVSFFREVADEFSEDEAMVQIWWDTEKQEFFPVCLQQTTTKTSVRYLRDKNLELDDKKVCVMDIHSHNTMDAFWSGTDNANEKETRVYGVVGKIKDKTPKFKFRYSVAGDFRAIGIFDVFEQPKCVIDGIGEFLMTEETIQIPHVDFPSEWLEIVRAGKQERSKYYNTNKDRYLGSGVGSINKSVGSISSYGRQMTLWGDEFESNSLRRVHGGRPINNEKDEFNNEEEDVLEGIFDDDATVDIDELIAAISTLDEESLDTLVEELIAYGYEDALLDKLRKMGYHISMR